MGVQKQFRLPCRDDTRAKSMVTEPIIASNDKEVKSRNLKLKINNINLTENDKDLPSKSNSNKNSCQYTSIRMVTILKEN